MDLLSCNTVLNGHENNFIKQLISFAQCGRTDKSTCDDTVSYVRTLQENIYPAA